MRSSRDEVELERESVWPVCLLDRCTILDAPDRLWLHRATEPAGIFPYLRFRQPEYTHTRAATDDRVARLRAAAGDRFDDLELQSFVGFTNFTDDRTSLAEMMAGAFGVSPEEALETPVVLAGTLEQMIEDVQARRERWGMSYVVVGVDVMEQFAPAVARLAGT